jgi:hypothetical protein
VAEPAEATPMRARILPLAVAGVLALTAGVALAETSPPDPEVVLTPVDDATTTTTVDVPTTTETTVVAPPETTTTTTVAADEPDEVPRTDVTDLEPEPQGDAPERQGPDAHPENHGLHVSRAVHDHEGEGNHGAAVSAVARSDAGKRRGGAEPEED